MITSVGHAVRGRADDGCDAGVVVVDDEDGEDSEERVCAFALGTHSTLGSIGQIQQTDANRSLFTRLLPMVAFAFHPRNILVATSTFSVLFLSFECLDIAFLPNTD